MVPSVTCSAARRDWAQLGAPVRRGRRVLLVAHSTEGDFVHPRRTRCETVRIAGVSSARSQFWRQEEMARPVANSMVT